MVKRIFTAAFLFFLSFGISCFAQEITITSSVDRQQISLDQQIVLSVTVSGNIANIPQPPVPALSDFNVYSSGQRQNVSIVNGKVSSVQSFNYMLIPKKTGKFTIPPFSLQWNGKAYTTNPINIEVVKGNAVPSQPQTAQQQAPGAGTGNEVVFVTGSVDKNMAYVNEQITYSFKFYRRVNLLSNPDYKPPEVNGFWIEDLPPQKTYYEDIKGVRYLVVELKTALFPTAPGQYKIGSANLVCNVEDFSQSNGFDQNFFKNFFSMGKTQTLSTNPIAIKVLPIPQNEKPKNYTGTVGQYSIRAEVDKTRVECNQPVTLKITISGSGNIKTIAQPKIEGLQGFRKYETVSSLSVSKDNYIVQGSKTFTTMIVPQTQGELTIPAIETNFFNPASKNYRTISTNPIKLKVIASTKPAFQAPLGFAPKEIKFLGKDIRYIKTYDKFSKNSRLIYKRTWFVFLQIISLLAFIAAWLYSKYYQRLLNDVKFARLTRSYTDAMKALKAAKRDDILSFACTISGTLAKYIADKLGLAAAGLTSQAIECELLKSGVEQDLIKDVLSVTEKCDFIRFAPAQGSIQEAEQVFEKTKKIIDELEKIFKKRKK